MKAGIIILSVMVLLNNVVAQNQQNQFSIDDYTKMDAEQKRKLFSEGSKGIDDPAKFWDLFILGLQDPDPIVRRNAVGKLSFVMVGLQNLKRERGSIPMDMSKIGEVQDLLITNLSSPDAQIRGAAMQALAYSGEPNAKVESALLGQLAQEPDEQLKGGIIETMGFAGYESSAYVQVLRESILAPSGYVRDAAAKSVAAIKPQDMLPILAQSLEKNRTGIRWAVDAIAAYGVQAQPYLPLLEKLAADPTLPSDLRERARQAIAAIKNPPPQAAATPRVRAISLVDDTASKPPTPTTTAAQTTPVPTAGTPVQQPQSTVTPSPTAAETKSAPSGFPIVPVAIVGALIVGIVLFILRRKSK